MSPLAVDYDFHMPHVFAVWYDSTCHFGDVDCRVAQKGLKEAPCTALLSAAAGSHLLLHVGRLRIIYINHVS